ncbi:hypothetical protein [uncultured Proteiniphilum sp.]|uniref:hypothetical protein n=1 Tax=uncultured Proteiniphilum sp. TaxID=497637 RepID=UPI00262ED850|nr:hypothetical protein [uncultured Proteiniphilum sp.]
MTSNFLSIRLLFFICLTSILTTGNIRAQPGKVRVNGITIAYESFGDTSDETIIMIQGTGATLLHYPVELCEKLAANTRYKNKPHIKDGFCDENGTMNSTFSKLVGKQIYSERKTKCRLI